MSSLKNILEGIELDIEDFKSELLNKGYDKEGVRNFLRDLSKDSVNAINEDAEKMAEIIKELIDQPNNDSDAHDKYREFLKKHNIGIYK